MLNAPRKYKVYSKGHSEVSLLPPIFPVALLEQIEIEIFTYQESTIAVVHPSLPFSWTPLIPQEFLLGPSLCTGERSWMIGWSLALSGTLIVARAYKIDFICKS